MTKGKKVLFGMLFGQVTEFAVLGIAIKSCMNRPLLFGALAGAVITLAVVLGIAASGVDAEEEKRMERKGTEAALLHAQVESLKRSAK